MTNSKLNTTNKKLLIIPCSKTKNKKNNCSAIDLYDGPFFKVIRKHNPKNFDIIVMSAKYGIIDVNKKISYYDQKMTLDRAKELSTTVSDELDVILTRSYYDEVYINLGKIYFEALKPSLNLFKNTKIHMASGGIGMRLHYLRNWICQDI